MAIVYVAFGSNIQPKKYIRLALEELSQSLKIINVSPFYQSKAVGNPTSPDFINGVLKAETSLNPFILKFKLLRPLEDKLGRKRSIDKNATRTIDLDLILYDKLIINEEGLVIPDPNLKKYPFVSIPLIDIWPEAFFPGTEERIKDLFPLPPERYGLKKYVLP